MDWKGIPVEYQNQIVTGDAKILAERMPDESQLRLFNHIPFELNTIIEGDCLELLPQLPNQCIDVIITDSPFAITGGLSNGRTSRADDQFFSYWFTDVVREFIRVLKPEGCGFLWCDWRSESAMVKAFEKASERYEPWWIAQVIYHDREMVGMGLPFRNQVDRILFFRGKKFDNRFIPNTQPNIIRSYWYYGKHEWHDSEKSPEVTAQLVKWVTAEGEIVLDPFTGGGTIPAVCKMLGRNYVAFEIDPSTANRARERVQNTQSPLFVLREEQLALGMG